jgi:hypothetical protein
LRHTRIDAGLNDKDVTELAVTPKRSSPRWVLMIETAVIRFDITSRNVSESSVDVDGVAGVIT